MKAFIFGQLIFFFVLFCLSAHALWTEFFGSIKEIPYEISFWFMTYSLGICLWAAWLLWEAR